MCVSPTFFRSGRAWWGVFGLLIAAPALALSWLGLRVVGTERIELEQLRREQQSQFARLAEAAIEQALAEIETELRSSETISEPGDAQLIGRLANLPVMSFRRSGLLTFPGDRLYFGEFGHRPDARVSSTQWSADVQGLVAVAQATEARGRRTEAEGRYQRIAEQAPGLAAWAEISVARLRYQGGDEGALEQLVSREWSESDGLTPSGLPAALVACAYAGRVPPADLDRFTPLLEDTLASVRAGAWWLSAEERRFHDAELRRLLQHAGATDPVSADARFDALDAIATLVQRSPPSRRDAATRIFERDPRGALLIVWVPVATDSEQWIGVALSPEPLADVLEPVLVSLLSGEPFRAELRDAADTSLWSPAMRVAEVGQVEQLRAVPGWQLAFSDPSEPTGIDQQRWLWFGFIGLLLVMLLTGVAMTAYSVRHEVELGRRQSEFVAAVSHEFKSPITSIRILMERLMGGRVGTAETTAEYYVAIERETGRLERLVNRLLDSQQIETGQHALHVEPSSLVDLVTQAIHRLQPQAEAKRIQVDATLEPDIPTVRVDRAAIGDALDNLIDNAVKYSSPGSAVTIRVQRVKHRVRIDVSDHGIGIDADDLPRIFDKFYRARRGDRQDVRGTGLGLALVKATVEAHGGVVEVSSVAGEGTHFSLHLPLDPVLVDS